MSTNCYKELDLKCSIYLPEKMLCNRRRSARFAVATDSAGSFAFFQNFSKIITQPSTTLYTTRKQKQCCPVFSALNNRKIHHLSAVQQIAVATPAAILVSYCVCVPALNVNILEFSVSGSTDHCLNRIDSADNLHLTCLTLINVNVNCLLYAASVAARLGFPLQVVLRLLSLGDRFILSVHDSS